MVGEKWPSTFGEKSDYGLNHDLQIEHVHVMEIDHNQVIQIPQVGVCPKAEPQEFWLWVQTLTPTHQVFGFP